MGNSQYIQWRSVNKCKEPQFKGQHMDAALPPDIINKEEEYEVKEIRNHRKQESSIQFLVY